jgi:hypothetical protein
MKPLEHCTQLEDMMRVLYNTSAKCTKLVSGYREAFAVLFMVLYVAAAFPFPFHP